MRRFADCKLCKHKHTRHCLPCEAGENFEPEENEGLDFDRIPNEFWEFFRDE